MNRKYLMSIAIIIFAFLLTQILFVSAHAASSTNVSLESDLYSNMEFWVAEGLIEGNLYSIKPFARSEVGRQLVTAHDNCYAGETPSATCRYIQQYYEKLYETEITETRSPANIRSTFLKPIENFSVSHKYLSDPYSIYNNEGIHYGEGHNAMIQLQSRARLRFGNAMGSRGSVIDVFLEQIGQVGPVTITYPEMKRYFMTIPEAVLLVLQAGAMGEKG